MAMVTTFLEVSVFIHHETDKKQNMEKPIFVYFFKPPKVL